MHNPVIEVGAGFETRPGRLWEDAPTKNNN
jgi:hypothetical protein